MTDPNTEAILGAASDNLVLLKTTSKKNMFVTPKCKLFSALGNIEKNIWKCPASACGRTCGPIEKLYSPKPGTPDGPLPPDTKAPQPPSLPVPVKPKRRSTNFASVLGIVFVSVLIIIFFTSRTPPTPPPVIPAPEGSVILSNGDIVVGGNGKPVILRINPQATNPTFPQLQGFLQSDDTDCLIYNSNSFIDSDFAAALFNNAQEYGIRVAYVVLLGADHALNAFETTDAGLVYVDFTGTNQPGIFLNAKHSGSIVYGNIPNYKKIAYVQIGKPLGFISLNVATLHGFNYQAYEKWQQGKTTFDTFFNDITQDRTYVGSLAKPLGGFWSPSGSKVTGVETFWRGFNPDIDKYSPKPINVARITPPAITPPVVPPVLVPSISVPTKSPSISKTPPIIVSPTSTFQINQGIDKVTGQYNNYYIGLVKEPDGTYINNYGDFIVLINNKDAKNPTYSQLVNFLKSDRTDQYPYILVNSLASSYYGTAESHVDLDSVQKIIDGTKQPNTPRICSDFAEMLHNNAEKAQIRCAYVSIDFATPPGHALVAFETTDRGLIYIDDTGVSGNSHPSSCDKIVDVQVGKSYIPQSLFPETGWNSKWENIGTVTGIFMTWDGKWNNN